MDYNRFIEQKRKEAEENETNKNKNVGKFKVIRTTDENKNKK